MQRLSAAKPIWDVRRAPLTAVVLVASVGFAWADDRPACDRFDWPLATERAWFEATDLPSIETGTKLPALPSKGFNLKLKPAAEVTLSAATRAPRAEAPKSGVVTFDVPAAGLYQVTISGDGWVDAVQDGALIAAEAHTGNRECVGLRKSVRFRLKTSVATIQVTSVPADQIAVGIRPVE